MENEVITLSLPDGCLMTGERKARERREKNWKKRRWEEENLESNGEGGKERKKRGCETKKWKG